MNKNFIVNINPTDYFNVILIFWKWIIGNSILHKSWLKEFVCLKFKSIRTLQRKHIIFSADFSLHKPFPIFIQHIKHIYLYIYTTSWETRRCPVKKRCVKELSRCHKLGFYNHYIFATKYCRPWIILVAHIIWVRNIKGLQHRVLKI